MYIIEISDGCMLVQHRLPKTNNVWSDLNFPGGHMEPEEIVTVDAVP